MADSRQWVKQHTVLMKRHRMRFGFDTVDNDFVAGGNEALAQFHGIGFNPADNVDSLDSDKCNFHSNTCLGCSYNLCLF